MSKPDWNVAVIDGKPEQIINLAAMADLVRQSPLGVNEAMRRLKTKLAPDVFSQLQTEMKS